MHISDALELIFSQEEHLIKKMVGVNKIIENLEEEPRDSVYWEVVKDSALELLKESILMASTVLGGEDVNNLLVEMLQKSEVSGTKVVEIAEE